MSLFLKAKQAGLNFVKSSKTHAGAAAALVVTSPVFAQTAQAQPDVSEVVAYILASTATIALIGNASLIVRVSLRVYNWVRSAIR